MLKTLTRISTANMSREEWIHYRQKAIGGSDAAAIIGLNRFSSPYYIWADKLGKIPPKEETEAMRIGHDLEDYVAKRFVEATGKRVRRENAILYNPNYPFAHANVDRLIIGEDAGLECKTTSYLNMRKYANGEYPDNYYVQCMHYMMVTGCLKWYLAVLVLGKEFLWFEIERDENEISALATEEEKFWRLVEAEEPPATDGNHSTVAAIDLLYPESDGSEIDLSGYTSDLRQYIAAKEQIKEWENIRDEVGNRIKSYMESAERGYSDSFSVKWATQERRTFDTKRFSAEHPEIELNNYYKTNKFRKFDVKSMKEG